MLRRVQNRALDATVASMRDDSLLHRRLRARGLVRSVFAQSAARRGRAATAPLALPPSRRRPGLPDRFTASSSKLRSRLLRMVADGAYARCFRFADAIHGEMLKVAGEEIVDVERFRQILATSSGEREVVQFLRRAPWIPYWTFCVASGHSRYAIFEFPLGSVYKCDLLILNSYSGVWKGYFIEFESVDDPVFTRRGVPSRGLAVAQRQIDDWRQFVAENLPVLRTDMVRCAKRSDCLGYTDRRMNPSNFSGDLLGDPTSHFAATYVIVIGRSSKMDKERRSLLGRYRSGHDVEIVTYDRLLNLAQRRYGEPTGVGRQNPWDPQGVP